MTFEKRMADNLERVSTFRRKARGYWAYPGADDCLRYSVTEAAEAMDADLRQQRPDDARNNDRNVDVLDELADCAIMLYSALGPSYAFREGNVQPVDIELNHVDGVVYAVGMALANYQRWLHLKAASEQVTAQLWHGWVLAALAYIDGYAGMDLGVRIAARLERIKRKHVPEEAWEWPRA